MKKIIIGFIVIAMFSALVLHSVNKSRNPNVSKVEEQQSVIKYERPQKQLIVDDSAFVNILDIKGVEINLMSYNSVCSENSEGIDYQGSVLRGIFEQLHVFPIEKLSGGVGLYFIEQIDEYYFDGKNASILLKNGELIKGFPVKDYTISGRSLYGDISLNMENINFVKFNKKTPKDINYKVKVLLYTYLGLSDRSHDWPVDFDKENIETICQSNLSEKINAPVFIYRENGCDDNWIPCKPYTIWAMSDFISVDYGTATARVNIKDIKLANLSSKKGRYGKEFYFDFTVQNNRILKNVKEHVDNHNIIGILGLSKNGILFLPIDKIKQIKRL